MKMLNNFLTKHRIYKEFMAEHGEHMPHYTEDGQRLEWDIHIYKNGPYDVMTGDPLGEWEISVNQRCPSGYTVDDRAYKYNLDTKKIEVIPHCYWR